MTWRYLDDMVIGYTHDAVESTMWILLDSATATDHDQHHHHLMKGIPDLGIKALQLGLEVSK